MRPCSKLTERSENLDVIEQRFILSHQTGKGGKYIEKLLTTSLIEENGKVPTVLVVRPKKYKKGKGMLSREALWDFHAHA